MGAFPEVSLGRRLATWIPLTFAPGRGAPTRSMLTLGQPLSPFDWPLPELFRWFSPCGTHLMARLCGVRHLVTRSCRRDCREPMASDLKSRQTRLHILGFEAPDARNCCPRMLPLFFRNSLTSTLETKPRRWRSGCSRDWMRRSRFGLTR